MFARLFKGGGQFQQLRFVKAVSRNRCHQLRFSFGQRAGFINYQCIHLLHHFEGFGILHQYASSCAAPRADHNAHRRRQTERTRARDD